MYINIYIYIYIYTYIYIYIYRYYLFIYFCIGFRFRGRFVAASITARPNPALSSKRIVQNDGNTTCGLQSKLLKGGYIGDYIGDYYRGS